MSGRALLLLAALVLALAAAELWLVRREGRRLDAIGRAGLFVPEDAPARARPLAGITLEIGNQRHEYARNDGVWRCLTLERVPGLGSEVESLWKKLLEARGIVRSESAERWSGFGLDDASVARLTFHGPRMLEAAGGDRLLEVEIGGASAAASAYARLPPSPLVWELDQDPRVELQRGPAQGLPPLVDPSVVPAVWSAGGGRLQSVRLEEDGEVRWLLRWREVARTPDELREGRPALEWLLKEGEEESVVPSAGAYVSFLLQLPWGRVVAAPAQPPATRTALVLVPAQGRALTLELFPGGDGEPLVQDDFTGLVRSVDRERFAWLAPDAATLRTQDEPPPWAAFAAPPTPR